MSKLIENNEEAINKVLEFEESTFNVDILEKTTGKFVELINNNNEEFSYELKNKFYNFNFNEAVFIKSVKFNSIDNIHLKDLEIVSINAYEIEHSVTFKKGNNQWTPNKVLKGFKIRAPKRIFNKIKLRNIEILGYKLEEFSEISKKVIELSNLKDEIKENLKIISTENEKLNLQIIETDKHIKEERAQLEVEKVEQDELIKEKINNSNMVVEEKDLIIKNKEEIIEELKESENNYEKNILPILEGQKVEIDSIINNLIEKKDTITGDNTTLSNNVKQLTQTTNTLNSNISSQKEELRKLTEDTNIFATEMKEYIDQGNKDIKLYTKLSLIPWILIATVSIIVFWGTSDLTTIYNEIIKGSKDSVDISTIFWSRIPFAIIVMSILFVSYEVSKVFIKNIIHIHKQKRIFTKIGIIAKDVAEQSILGLEINEKEKFELRTKLKMDLLKSHLKNEIGEDFEYKINTSLIDYYNGLKLKKEKEIPVKEKNEE